MKTCIFLNGSIYDYEDIKSKIESENYDNIICADGGANHVYKMGMTPGYIIGDLDSVNPKITIKKMVWNLRNSQRRRMKQIRSFVLY